MIDESREEKPIEVPDPQVVVKKILKDKELKAEQPAAAITTDDRTVRSARSQLKSVNDIEIADCLTSKVYKSVETYNQLLILKHQQQQQHRQQQQSKSQMDDAISSKKLAKKPTSAQHTKPAADNSKKLLNIPDFITAVSISHKSAWAGVK